MYELERVLRVCNGFLCSMSVTYDGACINVKAKCITIQNITMKVNERKTKIINNTNKIINKK